MTRVLVTAALGNVGREVVQEVMRLGLAVRGAHLDPAALAARFPAIEAVRLDFQDRTTWAPALAGCDLVFLLRPPPVGNMEATLCPFVDAAYASGVRHIVFLSVAGADRMKWIPHRKVELHLIASGVAWTLLRPGFFAQNLQDAYRADIVEDGRIYVPAGTGRVAFVDVRDVAAVVARIFASPDSFRGQTLTLTGGEAIGFDDAAASLAEVLGRPIRYEAASIPGYARHLRTKRRMPWMQVIVQTVLHVGLRRGDAEQVDPTLARLLDQRPRTMREYIQDSASIWQR